MAIVRDLGSYRGPDLRADCAGEDPSSHSAVLDEGYLLALEYDLIRSRLLLLLDLRTSLDLDAPNTALLVVDGVTGLSWSGGDRPGERVQHTIGSWEQAVTDDGQWELTVVMMSGGGRLRARGASARFFYLDVPGCDDAPPDFGGASETDMARGLAGWGSDAEVVQVMSYPPWPTARPARFPP